MLEAIGQKWAEGSVQEAVSGIQWQFHCCGWDNASDRGLAVCPDEFDSGCKTPADEYMRPRFKEILISTSVEFSTLMISLLVLTVCVKLENQENAAELIVGLREF
jgi:hypothetical protein